MSAPSAVLFDAPGPRTRRRVAIAGALAVLVILALIAVAVLRLVDRGQFERDLWAPLIDPGTDEFAPVWGRIGEGLWFTLRAAAAAMVASLVIGVLLTTARLSLGRYGRLPLIGLIELLRGLPVVVTIFFVDALLPVVGIDIDALWVLAIGLTAYNMVIVSEILRAGIASLPRGQVEAGLAVGMTRGQAMRLIQLPQAFRTMLPALISQLIVILKDTAIASFVLNGIQDLMWQADNLRVVLDNTLQVYFVVALIYITINMLLDLAARVLERRLSTGSSGRGRGRAARGGAGPVAPTAQLVSQAAAPGGP